jgi:pantothenate kinase-related protein Tda10
MGEGKMSQQTSAQKWEQILIDDYRTYRWNQVMEPLCDKLQAWKDGEVGYDELDAFMEKVNQQICEVRNMLGQRRDRLVNLIQWWDREWFLEWVKEYAPPPGVSILPDADRPASDS